MTVQQLIDKLTSYMENGDLKGDEQVVYVHDEYPQSIDSCTFFGLDKNWELCDREEDVEETVFVVQHW